MLYAASALTGFRDATNQGYPFAQVKEYRQPQGECAPAQSMSTAQEILATTFCPVISATETSSLGHVCPCSQLPVALLQVSIDTVGRHNSAGLEWCCSSQPIPCRPALPVGRRTTHRLDSSHAGPRHCYGQPPDILPLLSLCSPPDPSPTSSTNHRRI